jgi:hypothetical protein
MRFWKTITSLILSSVFTTVVLAASPSISPDVLKPPTDVMVQILSCKQVEISWNPANDITPGGDYVIHEVDKLIPDISVKENTKIEVSPSVSSTSPLPESVTPSPLSSPILGNVGHLAKTKIYAYNTKIDLPGNGNTYSFEVSYAKNKKGSDFSPIVAVSPRACSGPTPSPSPVLVTPLPTPSQLINGQNCATITIHWVAHPPATTGYKIHEVNGNTIDMTFTAVQQDYAFENLTAGKIYQWELWSISGTQTSPPAFSPAVTALCNYLGLKGVTEQALSCKSITVKWNKSEIPATGYVIRDANGYNPDVFVDAKTLSVTLPAAPDGNTQYAVSVINGSSRYRAVIANSVIAPLCK